MVSSDKFSAAIGTVVMFGIAGLLAIVASPFTLAFTPEKNYVSYVIWIIQIAATLAYFYGDNMSYILVNYGDELGCHEGCVENNRIASVVLLGTAMLVLNIFPLLLGGYDKLNDKERNGKWYYTLDIIAVLLRIDIIFTTIAIMAQTSNYCSRTDESLGWSMFSICSVVGIAAIILTAYYTFQRLIDQKEKDKSPVHHEGTIKVSVFGIAIFLSFALMLYMLADNEQPIDCAWDCDSFASNSTRMEAVDMGMLCNETGNSVMRLVFMGCTLALVIVSLIWLGCDTEIAAN